MNKLTIQKRVQVLGALVEGNSIRSTVRMTGLHFMNYNFCRVHQTLKKNPAMAAGISDHIWKLEEIVKLLEKSENSN